MKFSDRRISDIYEDKLLEVLDKKSITADINNNDIIVDNNDNVFKGKRQYNTVATQTYGG